LGGRKGTWPVKNWVVGYCHGYLSGVRCRRGLFLLVKSRLVSPFWYRMTRVVLKKGSLEMCVCVCVWACIWGQETWDLSKAWNKHLNVFRWQFLWFWQVVLSRWLIGHECLTCKKMHTAIGFQPRWWNTVCTSHWRHLGDGFFIVDIIQVNGHKWCSHCRWLLVRAVLPLHSSVQRHPSAALQCSRVARLLVPRHQKHKMLTIEGWQIC